MGAHLPLFRIFTQTRARAEHTPKWGVFWTHILLADKSVFLGVQPPYFSHNCVRWSMWAGHICCWEKGPYYLNFVKISIDLISFKFLNFRCFWAKKYPYVTKFSYTTDYLGEQRVLWPFQRTIARYQTLSTYCTRNVQRHVMLTLFQPYEYLT